MAANVASPARAARSTNACPACGDSLFEDITALPGWKICRCGACGVRYAYGTGRGDRAQYDDAYRADGLYDMHVAAEADLVAGRLPKIVRAKRIAIEVLKKAKQQRVLEVGCGNGTFLAHLARAASCETYGIDVSANALEIAARHLKCPLHRGLLDDDAFAGKRFNAVCAWEVIEHVPAVEDWVQLIRRRLVPGGLFLMSTPNYESRWIWQDMPNDPRSRPPLHLTFWEARTLTGLLKRSGFDAVEVRHVSLPVSAARRSGGRLAAWVSYADAALRPHRRATLLAIARAGSSGR